ncbi:MAG: hypothetical protein GX330_01385, partial [Bacteroidales bacterium]|nr:hypothetical protein [Bacteroidales bacterium]
MKTFIQKFALTLICILSVHLLQGQYHLSCTNLNFYNSNFQNWTCKTASTQGVASTAYENLTWEISPNPINGRHTIMTDIYGYDANTCNGSPNSQLALVSDGFANCARIGSDVASHQANAIEYALAVDEDNALILLSYAMVFQNAVHDSSQQARFEIRIQDSLGNLLNTACNHYVVIADKNNPDFKQCGSDILWKDWSIMGVNLNSYIGQTVYISISIANSTYGDQFGYAYVAGQCMPMAIKVDFCCYRTPSPVARFDAPEGFIAYEWRDSEGNIMGKNQKISILATRHGAVYTVHMLSKMGCTSTLSYEIVCDSTVSDFACDSTTYKCYPTKVVLTALPYSRPTQITYWIWRIFKTSENQKAEHLSRDSIFEYTFQDTGYYKILLTVYAESGCADTASVIVYSYPSYGKVNITAPDEICNHIETEVFASGA